MAEASAEPIRPKLTEASAEASVSVVHYLRHNRIWPKVEVVLGILTIGETAGGEGSTVRQFKKFSVTLLRLEITQKQLQIKSTHIFNHSESIKEAGI